MDLGQDRADCDGVRAEVARDASEHGVDAFVFQVPGIHFDGDVHGGDSKISQAAASGFTHPKVRPFSDRRRSFKNGGKRLHYGSGKSAAFDRCGRRCLERVEKCAWERLRPISRPLSLAKMQGDFADNLPLANIGVIIEGHSPVKITAASDLTQF